MRADIIKAQMSGMAFAVHPKMMENLIGYVNAGMEANASVEKIANDSVTYEEKDNVAVVSIEGGMYKKNMSGLCMSVASYDQIVSSIDLAEANAKIDTILFRVDTPGGAVAGVDEVGERIFNSSKKTITLYENMGASAGIWAFTSSDEVYATETTNLGSIGVMVSYLDQESDKNIVTMVSKNAENKNCSLSGDCKSKIEKNINVYEDIFYARVTRNTGFTSEQIKSTFNSGDMIFATEAKEEGFIKEIVTFQSLLNNLMGGNIAAVPTASGGKVANSNLGENMEFNEENFNALEEQNKVLSANRDTLKARQETLTIQLEDANSTLDAKNVEIEGLNAKLSEAVSKEDVAKQLSAKEEAMNATIVARVEEAFTSKVATKETILAMVAEPDDTKAHKIALDAKPQTVALHTSEANSGEQKESSLVAYAKSIKGSMK